MLYYHIEFQKDTSVLQLNVNFIIVRYSVSYSKTIDQSEYYFQ